jgi:GGDEF domain-containing protein
MLMFDLDHFKSINDRFGHTAGDEVLRLFGQVVRASTRADDIIGRFGGEEFIAIVPGGLESSPNACAPALRRPARPSRSDRADGRSSLRAKHAGRNTVHIADEGIANDRTRMIAAVRRARRVSAEGLLPLSQRNTTV